MTALTNAVLESGLVDSAVIAELKRWGAPLDWSGKTLTDLPQILAKIQEALESKDTVELRDTDLDILSTYLTGKLSGRLVLPNTSGRAHSEAVDYCVTKLGEYVIPWTSEDIRDLLLDQRTYLRLSKQPGQDKPTKVFFCDVRELFFGTRKAFVVCTPAKR